MKRGQVAMEFIMTYGWAILIVLVAIGALAYFGVLSPSKFLPEKCLFSTGLGCRDFVLRHNGGNMQVNFTVVNGFGQTFTIPKDQISGQYKGAYGVCGPGADLPIPADDTQELQCNFSSSPGVGSQAKISIEMNYTLSGGYYDKLAQGDLSGNVQ